MGSPYLKHLFSRPPLCRDALRLRIGSEQVAVLSPANGG